MEERLCVILESTVREREGRTCFLVEKDRVAVFKDRVVDDDDNCNLEPFSKTTCEKDENLGRENLQSSSTGHGGG